MYPLFFNHFNFNSNLFASTLVSKYLTNINQPPRPVGANPAKADKLVPMILWLH